MSELPSFAVEHFLRRGGCETNDPEVPLREHGLEFWHWAYALEG